jgi:hypothetical protein
MGLPVTPPVRSVGGLVGRFLRDPGGWTHRTLHSLLGHLAAFGRAAILPAILIATLVVVALVVRWLTGRSRVARAVATRNYIRIRPPEQPDLAAAHACWVAIAAHLTSRRGWGARLPLAHWQFVANPGGVKAGLHVAGTVNADAVCRIISGAWPGATAVIEDPRELPPPEVPITAGQLRLAAADWLPFNARPGIDIHDGSIDLSQAASAGVDITTKGFENCLTADGWKCDDSLDECSTPVDTVHVSSSVNNYLTRYLQLLQQRNGASS